MKRLRKNIEPEKVRFFACGEYGSQKGRPHYHACLFGNDFPDRKLWRVKKGVPLYRSSTLERLWPAGFSTIGDVTFESAAYVARYIMKKRLGKDAEEFYESRGVIPEFQLMSLKPGIGAGWLEKYRMDAYPSDFVIVNGKKCKPPRYYDKIYELENEEEFRKVKVRRSEQRIARAKDNTSSRHRVRETILADRLKRLPRDEI